VKHYTTHYGAPQSRLKGPPGTRLQPGELAKLNAFLPIHDVPGKRFALLDFQRDGQDCQVAIYEQDIREVQIL